MTTWAELMSDIVNMKMRNSGAEGEAAPANGRERRQRVLKKAIASYNDRKITVECLVRDLSPSGVKLKLTTPLPLPDTFLLEIPMDGIEADCQVRWRREDVIGAVFLEAPRKTQNYNVKQTIDTDNIPGMRRSILRKPGM